MFSVFAIVAIGMSACGGKASDEAVIVKSPDDAVIVVGGQTVSKAMVDHWVPIEAIISRESIPRGPVPTGEVPDPPRYKACIGYTRTLRQTGPAPTVAQLRDQCRQRYEAVRKHMLAILVTYSWLRAESAAQGIKISSSEVNQKFARFKHEQFGDEAAFRRFLKYTGESLADELLIARMDLLAGKLQQKVIRTSGIPGARKFYKEFPRRWASKTSCDAEYVIPNCKQYEGPAPPEAVV